jgi:hypothetical protein
MPIGIDLVYRYEVSELFHWPVLDRFYSSWRSCHVFRVYSVYEVCHEFSAGLLLTDLGAAALVACDTAEALRLPYKNALDSLELCTFSGWASKAHRKGGVVRHFPSRLSFFLASTGIQSTLVVEAHVGMLELSI